MERNQRTIVHPDENLLTAFAERTLTPGERERVMTHLADCSDCRDAIFLAQQAAPEPELQAGLRLAQSEPRALRWRWAIVSTAGLLFAFLIAAPVLIYRHAENSAKTSPTQMAAPGQSPAQSAATAVPSAPSSQRPEESDASGLLRSQAATASKNEYHSRSSSLASASAAPRRPVAAASASSPAALPKAIPSQIGAQIAGSVTDPSGAAIPGATVSFRLSDATTRQVVTDPNGRFEIGAVPPGNYVAEFSAPGFQAATRDVNVSAQDSAPLSETLAPGSVSETVNVSAAAPQLQTENAPLQGTINGKEVSPLLPQGRNVTQLAPGISSQPAQAGVGGAMVSGVSGGLARSVARLSIKDGSLQSCIGATCTVRVLPSGAAQAVSVAFDASISLVVDANGNVYSTSDAGAHWVAIKSQWDGKAIALKVASPPSGSVKQSIGGPVATGPIAGSFAAPSIFSLTNDQGQVWLSSDEGQTWHFK